LFGFYRDEEVYAPLDQALSKLTPQLRCIATWRSSKWNIAPTNYQLALRLIEASCTDDLVCWYSTYALPIHADTNYPWLRVSKAVHDQNQAALDIALQKAKTEYSALGYHIVMRTTQSC
jgi:hypothetical protein